VRPTTPRQLEVLAFIRGTIHARGRVPTVREIADQFQMRSGNAVVCHLRALEVKGHLQREPGRLAIRVANVDPVLRYGGSVS
jgi:repressor LexA